MANSFDFIDRTARALPRAPFADWLIRLPLAGVLMQNGLNKFPLDPAMAEGFGVAYPLWILAAVGEVGVALLLVAGGLLRGALGDLVTRAAGAAAAVIVAGVIYVAYWAPPLDLLLFNQFHLLLIAAGLFLALQGRGQAG
jgi:putative oxidoreductase